MEIFAAVILLFIAAIMSSLGAVLLVRLIGIGSEFSSRVAYAAMIGPGAIMVPLPLIALPGDEGIGFSILVLVLLFLVGAVMIGWPIAHFATKRLDRLLQFDAQTFR